MYKISLTLLFAAFLLFACSKNNNKTIESEIDPPTAAHAIISHYHWDHLFGFLGFNPLFNPDFTFNMYGKEDKMTPQEIIQYIQNHTFWPVDMSMLEEGYAYRIGLAYYNGSIGSWVEQSETFKFRVEQDEK